MAKKKSSPPEPITPEPIRSGRDVRTVRLDLRPDDFERLDLCAQRRGLSKASYARMAVLDLVRADEAAGGS